MLALGIPTSVSFLSTLSLRRATDKCCRLAACHPVISIHALLTESDWTDNNQTNSKVHFYPRSPYGERQSYHQLTHHQSVFLSTLSLRRATRGGDLCYLDNIISIHALLTESDAWNRFTQRRDFISIHALLTESDLGNVEAALLMWNFYPRSPYGERLNFPAR